VGLVPILGGRCALPNPNDAPYGRDPQTVTPTDPLAPLSLVGTAYFQAWCRSLPGVRLTALERHGLRGSWASIQ